MIPTAIILMILTVFLLMILTIIILMITTVLRLTQEVALHCGQLFIDCCDGRGYGSHLYRELHYRFTTGWHCIGSYIIGVLHAVTVQGVTLQMYYRLLLYRELH